MCVINVVVVVGRTEEKEGDDTSDGDRRRISQNVKKLSSSSLKEI